MAKVKVTRKCQVMILKEVRHKTGVRVGDELLVREEGGKIMIESPIDIEKLAGSWIHIESTERFMAEVRGLWKIWRLEQF